MGFWRFYGEAIRRAFHLGFHAGHWVHAVIVFLIGAVMFGYGVHEENHYLVMAPFLTLASATLVGVFWAAWRIYHEEHVAKNALAVQLSKRQEEIADPRRQSRLASLARLIERGEAIAKGLLDSPDSTLGSLATRQLIPWKKDIHEFISSEMPLELEHHIDTGLPSGFLNPEHRGQLRAFVDRRLNALRGTEARVRGNAG
jgi:hypothetical protein